MFVTPLAYLMKTFVKPGNMIRRAITIMAAAANGMAPM